MKEKESKNVDLEKLPFGSKFEIENILSKIKLFDKDISSIKEEAIVNGCDRGRRYIIIVKGVTFELEYRGTQECMLNYTRLGEKYYENYSMINRNCCRGYNEFMSDMREAIKKEGSK